jgi:hypothetical protein
MNLQAQLADYVARMKMEQAARNQMWQDLKRISLLNLAHKSPYEKRAPPPPEPKPLTQSQRQEWRNEQFKAIRHLHTPIPLSDEQKAILEEARRNIASKPPERCKVAQARKRREWEVEKAKAIRNLGGKTPQEWREARERNERSERNRTMSSDPKRRDFGGIRPRPELTAEAVNNAIKRSIDAERAAINKMLDERFEARAEIHAQAFGQAIDQLLDDERAVITQILDENRKEDRNELADQIRTLRIELAHLETTVGELRAVVASERARVIDEKYNAGRRTDMN